MAIQLWKCDNGTFDILDSTLDGDDSHPPVVRENVPQANLIRELNDYFRQTFRGGKTVMTRAVADYSVLDRAAILKRVQTYTEFTKGDDPRGEHDFGEFTYGGQTLYWKIDYYDAACEMGSEDPSDPEQTTRVLTIMLASDY